MKNQMAVLFDMDGVIIDSNPFHKDAWFEFTRRHRVELKEEDVPKFIYGKTNTAALRDVFQKEFSPEESFALSEEKEAIYRELQGRDLTLVPGLRELLAEFRHQGIATAVCTNAPLSNLNFILNETGLREYFTTVIDASQVSKGKPDPEIYLKAAEMLQVPASRCIVMEDSMPGVEAGLRANMKVVALTTTHSAEELAHTHLVREDFTGLTIQNLEDLLH